MANVSGDTPYGGDQSSTDALNQAINQTNAAAAATNQQQTDLQNYLNQLGAQYGGVAGSATKYAPFDVGAGKTKWDEFVQQMQLENQKLQQAQDIENARLAQEKSLAEEKLQEEQKIADQNTVEAYNKNLTSMQGPKDPYGYLFASRGLSAPQGYAPVAAPIPQAVLDQYKSEGVDLQQAQQQLVGGSGPSFINGYLGGMNNTFQQGPMGFQNSPTRTASASQPQPQQPPIGSPSGTPFSSPMPTGSPAGKPTPQPAAPPPGAPPPGQPMHMATGGTVPGYAPGYDSVPAMLSPGEGILNPQAVQAMGGPSVVNQLNTQVPSGVQSFATGGMVSDPFNTFVDPLRGQSGTPTAIPGQPPSGADWSGFQQPTQPFQPTQITPTQVGSNYQIAGQNVGQSTVENMPGFGYTMTAPGIAMPGGYNPPNWSGPIGRTMKPATSPFGNENPTSGAASQWPGGILNGGGIGLTQAGSHSMSPWQGLSQGAPSPWSPVAPTAPQLTGGVQAPVGPPGGPVMNLNMLDPYTRALVDQYGRPQIPSAQALANMPQSGLDAYQNYVEKVAGGNFQDLLDQSKMLNPAGATPADFKFS